MILGKSVQFRTVYDALLFIRHLVYDALPISWGFFMTHLIFDASYISRILDFLCKMLYMCSVFIEFFVQFLGVIKCLNNPYFTICRIAHTKKPHIKNFKELIHNHHDNPTQIMCTLINKHLGNPIYIERR